MIECIRSHHIKVQFKLSITLCQEIIFHTAHKAERICITSLISYSVVHLLVMAKLEFLILVLHQDDKTFLLAKIRTISLP